jgi:hypothetical protein
MGWLSDVGLLVAYLVVGAIVAAVNRRLGDDSGTFLMVVLWPLLVYALVGTVLALALEPVFRLLSFTEKDRGLFSVGWPLYMFVLPALLIGAAIRAWEDRRAGHSYQRAAEAAEKLNSEFAHSLVGQRVQIHFGLDYEGRLVARGLSLLTSGDLQPWFLGRNYDEAAQALRSGIALHERLLADGMQKEPDPPETPHEDCL